MDLSLLDGPAQGHLTYCTNIHAAEHWQDMRQGLSDNLPKIKSLVSPDQPMGVGLRVAASAANSLADAACMRELIELLGDDYYVFTMNGFPYGAFHGQRVKDGAYAPDWSTPERLQYTNLLASQLAQLLPSHLSQGSVSTVPCTYKPWLNDDSAADRLNAIVANLVAHVHHLINVRNDSGKTIVLTLEPEPFCMLETIEETVSFFNESLFSSTTVSKLAALSGLGVSDAEQALRRHLGVCYDVCHAAVEFEDPRQSVQDLQNAGIEIGKLQLSSALKLPHATLETTKVLRPFDEPVYLHQTVERHEGVLRRFNDLDEAFASLQQRQGGEWRSHFHVPVFLQQMQDFATTQDFLREILSLHRSAPISQHLEVETYTWDVLPQQYRSTDLASAIARELNWVKAELA